MACIPLQLSEIVQLCIVEMLKDMYKEGIYVNNIESIEHMGCVNDILINKRGLLTQNKLKVATFYC